MAYDGGSVLSALQAFSEQQDVLKKDCIAARSSAVDKTIYAFIQTYGDRLATMMEVASSAARCGEPLLSVVQSERSLGDISRPGKVSFTTRETLCDTFTLSWFGEKLDIYVYTKGVN